MNRPMQLDLTSDPEWTPAPMPGANQGIELHRLDSRRGHFTIFAKFPAGFERDVAGGYEASEEFLVLDGELELQAGSYRRGDLTIVPGRFVRTHTRSPSGCRALAWFGGPPVFLPPAELTPCDDSVSTGRVGDSGLPSSEVASWAVGTRPSGVGEIEVVTADLSRWRRGEPGAIGPHDLVRRDL